MKITAQTVFRNASPDKNFTVLRNEVIEDTSVSADARFLLIACLSRPRDWEFNRTWMMRITGYGRDKTDKLLIELANAGYCAKDREREKSGTLKACVYRFTDTAGAFASGTTGGSKPLTGNQGVANHTLETSDWKPVTGEPLTENQAPYKETKTTKKNTKDRLSLLKSEVKSVEAKHSPAFPRAQPIHNVRTDSPQGRAWLDHWDSTDREDLVSEARQAGGIRVPSLWPPKDAAE